VKQWIKDRIEYLDRIKGIVIRWMAFYAVLVYSMRHVAHFFNSMDTGGWGWGWVAAFAIDATIAAAAHGSDKKQRGKIVTITVIVFTMLSVFANLDYTLTTALGSVVIYDLIWTLDYWQLGKAFAVASPPLLVFGLAEILKEADEQQPAVPEPSTALATTNNHVGNHPQQPTVNVAPPPQQQARQPRQHRLKRPQPALTTLPTMPTLTQQPQQPVAKSTHKNHQQPSQQLDDELVEELVFANQQPLQGLPIPTTDLDKLLAQAVVVYQGVSSYDKAGARLGVSGEMVRKRVRAAFEQDPDWVAQILPTDKLPK